MARKCSWLLRMPQVVPQFRASETLALLFLASPLPMNGLETLTFFPSWPFSDLAVSPVQAVTGWMVAASSIQHAHRAAIYTGHLQRLAHRVPGLHPPMRGFLRFGG